jgi:hypothetical protein
LRCLAVSGESAACVRERDLVIYDIKGNRVAEQKLERRAEALARFGDEWLVLEDKQKHLTRIHREEGSGEKRLRFAAGKAAISALGVGRDDTVVVARGDALELWTRDDKRKWSAKGGPFLEVAIAREYVVALEEAGALVFLSREKGEVLGALRLASPEAVTTWRLAHVDGVVVVLALGEWLVWIDASTRKTVRRVRARAKIHAVAADGGHVVVAVEEGVVQAFRATTGEPRAAFAPEDSEGVSGLALGANVLFTTSETANVRARDRQTIDATVRAASPIGAISARGELAVVGDRTGRIRVIEASSNGRGSDGTPRVRGEFSGVEGNLGVFIAKDSSIVAGGARMILRVPPPYKLGDGAAAPRPIALKGVPTTFASDDAYAFAGTQTGDVDVYDLAAARHVTTYTLSSDDRITALIRLTGTLLVVGTGALDGRILFVDVADAKVVHRVSPHDEAFGVTCLAADARGRIVASGGDDGFVALLDPVKGRVLARLRVNETPVSMAFEPAGRRLAVVFADGTASIITFAPKGATLADLGVRGATCAAWGDGLVFGFKDGHAETGERHAPASDRPAARQ